MRKKNTLYMVNRWNRPAFTPKENLFAFGAPIELPKTPNMGYSTSEAFNANLRNFAPKENAVSNPLSFKDAFGKAGIQSGLKSGAAAGISAGAGIVGGLANGLISGGLNSGAGSAISGIGSTVGSAVGAVNPLLGAAVTVGSGILGGVTNALFGEGVDEEKLRAAREGTAQLNSFVSNAGSFDDVKGPQAVANVEDAYSGGLFTSGSARRKNEELKRQRAEAKMFADRSILNNVNNLAADQLNNALATYAAFGGPLDTIDPSTAIGYSIYTDKFIKDKQKENSAMTNMFAGTPDMFKFGGGIYTKGANFDTGVSFINTGGTHEENPNDGVPMGVDSLGVPNLVEEGEVRWGDYMFSDRLIVPRGKRGNYGKRVRKYAEGGKLAKGRGVDVPYESLVLKPYEGLTFAEAAKKIIKKNGADERDDAITMRGVDAELSVLAGIQEKEREKEKLREMQEAIDNMSPEEFAMLQLQMEAQLAALQLLEMAMQQLQMIPLGMELMQPVEEQLPIAALGGLLNTYNLFKYGGNLEKFAKDLEGYGLTIDDYLAYYAKSKNVDLEKEPLTVTDETFDKDLAEQFLDRAHTISKQYARRAKQQGIKEGELKGTAKALYNRDLALAVRKGLSDGEYNVALDDQISFNNSRVTSSGNRQQSYNDLANYNNLLERGGRKVTLDENGRPTWDNIEGLTKIDNSAENFYNNLGELNEDALLTRGIYDYKMSTPSSISNKDNIRLYGWKLGDDGNYNINLEDVSPNKTSLIAGNTENTYPTSNLGELAYGAEGYKEALDNIQNNKAYQEQTSYILDAIKAAGNDYSKLPKEVQNYLEYLDNNSGNVKLKLLTRDEEGNITGIAENASSLYDRRRKDNKYGIYHYLFDRGNDAAANRYFYKDGDNKVYVSKPGEGFSIGLTPEVITGDDGTIFNDYEVTGFNKGRTLTQLPTGEVVDVTDLADLPNWKKLDKPVLVDNTDNLGYGIKGTTDWVDYGSSPTGQKVAEDENPFPKPSSWPFALAAGLLLGSLGYNILKPADYSNADALLSASKDAGIYKPVEFRPIGNYLPYKPLDIWYEQNRLNANARATDRAILNSGANQGSKAAALLASGYNNQLASGNLFRQALEYNDALRKQVGEFNKDTDKFNSEGFLKADMANQDAATRAAGYTLEGKRAAYAMRQAIDDAKANAINAGLSGLVNLAYNYGTNRDQIKLLGWSGKSGAYGPMDMSKYGREPAAHGGRIRRKKGLSF